MSEKNPKQKLLAPEVIFSAVDGNEQAMMEVIEFYNQLIHFKFKNIARKKGVPIFYMPLEDMKQEVKLSLCKGIPKFKSIK